MRGVLVIDNTARGPGKGGTRVAASLSVESVARLARVMTLKWASADLFFGGAKAGMVWDPARPEKEAALRAFVRALKNEVPAEYVYGLDMGLQEADAAIILDELRDRGAVVGTPAVLGGIPYDELGVTGYGVAEATAEAAPAAGLRLDRSTVAIQGFGAVGAAAARRLAELGATVVAVSTSFGCISSQDGLDVAKLLELRDVCGEQCVLEYAGVTSSPPGTEVSAPADILIPAAKEDLIGGPSAATISAKLVVEGANLPLDSTADELLAKRNVMVVPDIVANAGGIIAAAFAMEKRYSPFRPETDPIFEAVTRRLHDQTRLAIEEARRRNVTVRAAARTIAERRIVAAMQARGSLGRRVQGQR